MTSAAPAGVRHPHRASGSTRPRSRPGAASGGPPDEYLTLSARASEGATLRMILPDSTVVPLVPQSRLEEIPDGDPRVRSRYRQPHHRPAPRPLRRRHPRPRHGAEPGPRRSPIPWRHRWQRGFSRSGGVADRRSDPGHRYDPRALAAAGRAAGHAPDHRRDAGQLAHRRDHHRARGARRHLPLVLPGRHPRGGRRTDERRTSGCGSRRSPRPGSRRWRRGRCPA